MPNPSALFSKKASYLLKIILVVIYLTFLPPLLVLGGVYSPGASLGFGKVCRLR